MSHLFRGYLCGYVCRECPEPLAGLTIRVYRLAGQAAAVGSKESFTILADGAVSEKADRLIGETVIDDEGNFSLELSDDVYDGGPIEVDVYCPTVPHRKQTDDRPAPVQFSVGVLTPEWSGKDVRAWDWRHCLPYRFWCAVRARFHAWTICGIVRDCKTQQPVSGVTVTAFDADWWQHDDLGSAVTGSDGKFRIDYLTSDFRKTPLSPLINFELIGGPDLFFKAEAAGSVVLDEQPSRGRDAGRENAGPCFCVDLCFEAPTPEFNNPWFTHIGDFHIYGDISPTTGLTNTSFGGHGGPDFGFFHNLKLKGFCPKTDPGDPTKPMRYRFLYVEGGNPPVPITGDSLVAPVVVGSRLIQWKVSADAFETTFQSIVVSGSGATPDPTPLPGGPGPWGAPPAHVIVPDAQGWVGVDQTAVDNGFYGPLLRFKSAGAVPGGTAPGDGAGNAVTDPKNGSDLAIIYEAEAIGGASSWTNQVDKVMVNNWAEVRQLNLVQFTGPGGTPCNPLSTDLDALYTVDHELLATWALSITSASGDAPGGVIPPFPASATPRGGADTHHEDISTWGSCSYKVWLSSRRALTNGEVDDDGDSTLVTFCK